MSRILDVYLHNEQVGTLMQNTTGRLAFTYDLDYIKNDHPALSLSLPLQSEPFDHDLTNAFFSGLLPDDILRQKLAKCLGVSEKNPFALLEAIGGDCAGAVSLYPHSSVPLKAFDLEDDL